MRIIVESWSMTITYGGPIMVEAKFLVCPEWGEAPPTPDDVRAMMTQPFRPVALLEDFSQR